MPNAVVLSDRAVSFSFPLRSPLLGIMIMAGLLLFYGLGDLGLTDRDEGSNAEAAREMLETGNWLSPTLNYEPRFAKPAFTYWLIGGAYHLFGVNEFAARLPSALSGLALIGLQYLFLSRLCGTTRAMFGTLILLLNIEMIAINRMVLTDPELVLFTTFAGYCFWLGLQEEERSRRYFWGSYFGMALAMLTKGPVGLVIPLLGIVPYLTVTRQWRRFWRVGFPIQGTLAVLAISIPWYLAMFVIHGAEYLEAARANTTGRFANPMEGHGGTLLFYVPVLLLGFFPWSAMLPMALREACKEWKMFRAHPEQLSATQHLALFAALWTISIFAFFTLSATRLPHYIYPLFPAASILVALYWSRCLNDSTPPGLRGAMMLFAGLGYLLGLGFAAVPGLFETFDEILAKEFPAALSLDVGFWPVVTGAGIVAGTMTAKHLANSQSQRPFVFWLAGSLIVWIACSVLVFGMPVFDRYFIAPPQELAMIAGYNLTPKDELIQFGRRRPSLAFYAKRRILYVSPSEHERLEPYRHSPTTKMLILQRHLRGRLPEPFASYPVVLDRHGFVLLSSRTFLQ